jgi:hypothetical protein
MDKIGSFLENYKPNAPVGMPQINDSQAQQFQDDGGEQYQPIISASRPQIQQASPFNPFSLGNTNRNGFAGAIDQQLNRW